MVRRLARSKDYDALSDIHYPCERFYGGTKKFTEQQYIKGNVIWRQMAFNAPNKA